MIENLLNCFLRDTKYLDLIEEDVLSYITISDKYAKVFVLSDIGGYDENDSEIGSLYLEEENDDSGCYTYWMYVDRSVTIQGEYKDIDDYYEDTEIYNLKLKKGWNVVYDSYTERYDDLTGKYVSTYSYTSQKPSGIKCAWYFYGDHYYKSTSIAKSAVAQKSFLTKLKEDRKNRIKK